MKKVLIVTNFFHSSPRIPGLVKYLPEFGWEPIILVPPLGEKKGEILSSINIDHCSSVSIVETDYSYGVRAAKRLAGLDLNEGFGTQISNRMRISPDSSLYKYFTSLYWTIFGLIHYPDIERAWKPYAIQKAQEILENKDVDAIISSSSPVITHLIAHELKEKYDIKWIAELRDLWSQNHNYSYGRLRHYLDKRLEVHTLANADVLVTVSSVWVEKLRCLHRKNRVYSIPNGYDPDTIHTHTTLSTSFSITYTGQIYPKKQDVKKFFVALKELIDEGIINTSDVSVRFFGAYSEPLGREIRDSGLEEVAKQCGRISRSESIRKQQESQVLLLLNWEDKMETGCYPLKIFEYLAAHRPILATGGSGKDVVDELLEETDASINATSVGAIKSAMAKYYAEFKENKCVEYKGKDIPINQYSYREMARKYAAILSDTA